MQIGTRFPALPTSLGKVLLAALPVDELERVLAQPTRSGPRAALAAGRAERDAALREVRARGWALTDEQLAPGIRSVAAPLRDGAGRVIAALNVNTHAAETPGRAARRRAPAHAAGQRRGRSAPTSPGSRRCRTRPLRSEVALRHRSGQLSGRSGGEWDRQARCRGCSSRTSRACWPGRTPRCCWPTWAPRWSRSSRPTATRRAPGPRPPAMDVSTYYLGINRGKRSIALDLRDEGDLAARPRARPPGRRDDPELQAGRAGQVRARRGHRRARPTPASSTPRSAGSAPREGAAVPGYDLMVQAVSGLMSLTGDAGRAAVPGGDLGVRRHGGQARGDRHPGRAAAPRRDRGRARRWRSTCCPRRSRAWSTTAPPRSPGEWCRSGWATPTPASTPTSRCPPPTAT